MLGLLALGCATRERSPADLERLAVVEMCEDPANGPRLIEILKDPTKDELVRAQAAVGLAGMGGADGEAALLGALGDVSAYVRKDVCDALGKRGASAAGEGLVARLSADPDPDVRRAAARALGSLRFQPAVPALIAALDDRDRGVSVLASEALTAITGENHGRDRKAWEAWVSTPK